MPPPKLSVLVPTRSRADTLKWTLRTLTDQSGDGFEIVVSDNCGADRTRNVVKEAADARIRYVRADVPLSMCDNYELALSNARGDYVVIVGDDDGVMPGAIDHLVDVLAGCEAPTIHSWPLHVYDWPVGTEPGRVDHLAAEHAPTAFSLRERARRAYRLGGWRYGDVPSPYHAAVPRAFLDALRDRTGRVFHSTQPDVFTGMALPAFTDRAVNLGRVITFNGRSGKSNGRGFVDAAALPNIERFLAEYGQDYKFHPFLPEDAAAAAVMIPDAVLKAGDLFPEIYGDVRFIDWAMWAYVCRLGFTSRRSVLARAVRGTGRLKARDIPPFLMLSAIHEASAVRRRMLNHTVRRDGLDDARLDTVHDFAIAAERRRTTPPNADAASGARSTA